MSRFKIVCCSTAFLPAHAHGGLPYSTFNLSRALINAGADVRVVTTDRNGADRLDVETDRWTTFEGVPVWYARTSPGPYLQARSTKRALSEALPESDCLINSSTLWVHSGYVAWRLAKRFQKPAVSYLRGLLDPWAFNHKGLRKRAYWTVIGRRILGASAAIVALSPAERETFRALGLTNRIEVIPNGAVEVNLAAVGMIRSQLAQRFPALGDRRYVLFLGRIHPKKGLDVLLPAIEELRKGDDRTAFVIAGPVDPEYREAFDDLVRRHGLESELILPGPVTGAEKTAWLKHATLFVLPSYSEGLPVAVLEALGAGCPVVISSACNLPEVARAGAGLEIAPDFNQLVEAVRRLLSDEPCRREMSARALELVRTTFDWAAIGARTLALCREISGRALTSTGFDG